MIIGRDNCLTQPALWVINLCAENAVELCYILHESSTLRIIVASKKLATLIPTILGVFGLRNHKLKMLLNFWSLEMCA